VSRSPTEPCEPRIHRLRTPSSVVEAPAAAAAILLRLIENSRSCLIVVDPAVAATGYGSSVIGAVRNAAAASVTLSVDVEENTPRDCVRRLIDLASVAEPDTVIAIGGGSTLDLAKLANAVGTVPQVQEAVGVVMRRPRASLIAVPTTCGTGSETTPFAVMLDPAGPRKRGVESGDLLPDQVVLDPLLLRSLPSAYVAATAVDALAHAVESSVSRFASGLTRCSAHGVIREIVLNLPRAVAGESAALARLQTAAASARLLYPRTGLTTVHALSHPLGAVTGMHHGAAVAVLLLPASRANVGACPGPFAALAEILTSARAPQTDQDRAGWVLDQLADLLADLPLRTLTAVPELTGEQVRYIASEAMTSSNIPSNPGPVHAGMLEEVLAECLSNR